MKTNKTFDTAEFERLNEMYKSGKLTFESDEQLFRRFNDLYIQYVSQFEYHQPRLKPGILKQFETGKIVNYTNPYTGKTYKYQVNEYRGVIISKCITNSLVICKNHWVASFKGDELCNTINYIPFYHDKFAEPFIGVLEGSLSDVIKGIDEALHWQSDTLPYGTMYVRHIKHDPVRNIIDVDYPFGETSIKYIDNLKRVLMNDGFILTDNATYEQQKIMQDRAVMPLGKIFFGELNKCVWTDDNIFQLVILGEYYHSPATFQTNQIKCDTDLRNAWDVFYNEMKTIDPSLFNESTSNVEKIQNVFIAFLNEFYN